jgi:rsbT co-antagonist protein RsbR
MPAPIASCIPDILASQATPLLSEWLGILRQRMNDRVSAAELESQCKTFLQQLADGCRRGSVADPEGAAFDAPRELLGDISRQRAIQGVSPSESVGFVFTLKQPLFARLRIAAGSDAEALAEDVRVATDLLDSLGLSMMEQFQVRREEVIVRQQQELAELSTPVVKLWQGILALPLIGTLDSSRTQVVMENLLESIVRHEADIAIIDITGVPTVDTLVAQHLLKTVAAARLMGADCIISGIRPQIAQTMVHLGVELNVVSKATLADAFALALQRLGRTVVSVRRATDRGASHAQ